jgi:hypothetical protein
MPWRFRGDRSILRHDLGTTDTVLSVALPEPSWGGRGRHRAGGGRDSTRNRLVARRVAWPAALTPSIALAGGLVAGALILMAHESRNAVAVIGEIGGPWVLAAFAAGTISRNRGLAALAGVVAMVAMLIGYYGLASTVDGVETAHAFRFWLAAALVAGPALGFVGWHALSPVAAVRVLSIAVLAGYLVAEGYAFWSFGNRLVPAIELAVGIVVSAFLPSRAIHRAFAVASTALIAALAIAWLGEIQAIYRELYAIAV